MPSIINATTTNGVAISPDNSGSLQLATNNGTTAVTIDTSQNVGVGTTTINDRLVVQSSSAEQGITIRGDGLDAIKIGVVNPSVSNDGVIGMKINNALRFITNNTERMRITSGGLLMINTTSNPLPGNGSGRINMIVPSGDDGVNIRHDHSGNCVNIWRTAGNGNAITFYQSSLPTQSPLVGTISTTSSSTSYATSSDYRLKENIQPMTGALGLVQQLKPVTYNWKVDGSAGQGFIAHELQDVVPDCVTGEKDAVEIVDIKDEEGNVISQEERPVYQGVDTSFLVATLTAAIQELKAQLDESNLILTSVKTELDTVKAELQALKGTE